MGAESHPTPSCVLIARWKTQSGWASRLERRCQSDRLLQPRHRAFGGHSIRGAHSQGELTFQSSYSMQAGHAVAVAVAWWPIERGGIPRAIARNFKIGSANLFRRLPAAHSAEADASV